MSDSDELDYNLSNASTNATLIVAVVFGLFAILGLLLDVRDSNYVPNVILSAVYFGLVLFGCYLIDRWMFYKTRARHIVGIKKDDAWKDEQFGKVIGWFFERAIFWFFTLGFFAWFAVVLFLVSPPNVQAKFVLFDCFACYLIVGIFLWAVAKTPYIE